MRDGLDLAPLPDRIGYALRRAQVAAFKEFSRAFAASDIRPVQLAILTVTGNNPGLKPSELSAALGVKRTNLVPLLDGLAARGLIERIRITTDRRSHALHLTARGRELLADLQRREAEMEARIAAAIGDGDRRLLFDLLAKVEAACREAAEPEAE